MLSAVPFPNKNPTAPVTMEMIFDALATVLTFTSQWVAPAGSID
jgi:hypothetical protein